MLEALQDIEIASRLVGFDVDNDDSLDDKYMKLGCDIVPLPRDSDDYQLIEKYLLTTHAPTHTVGFPWNPVKSENLDGEFGSRDFFLVLIFCICFWNHVTTGLES